MSLGSRVMGSNCSLGFLSSDFLLLPDVPTMKLHHLCNKQREKVLFKPNHKEKRQALTYQVAQISKVIHKIQGGGGGRGRGRGHERAGERDREGGGRDGGRQGGRGGERETDRERDSESERARELHSQYNTLLVGWGWGRQRGVVNRVGAKAWLCWLARSWDVFIARWPPRRCLPRNP